MIIILHPDVTSINYLTNLPWSSKILIRPIDERNITTRRQKHKAPSKSPEVIKETLAVEIIGDNLLNNINARGISKHEKIKVLNHLGATSEDLKDFINPTIRRKPNIVVMHIGTNDITENIDTISNLQNIVKRILKSQRLLQLPSHRLSYVTIKIT